MAMTEVQKEAFVSKIKAECGLTELRPVFMSETQNEYGLLQINAYHFSIGKGRTLIGRRSVNAANSLLRYCWDNDEKDTVIYDITHAGNEARDLHDIGICLIEVLDSDILSAEEFEELFNAIIKTAKRNDDLYKRLKQAMLKEITKDKKSLEAWQSISFGFKDRIGLEIWEGELQPTYIICGKTSQEISMEKMLEQMHSFRSK